MNTLDYHLDKCLGKNNWISFCIHLPRAIDRELSFKNWAQSIGLTFQWWDATDSLKLTEDDYKICDVIVNFKNKSSGATACRLSHMKLYDYFLKNYPQIQYIFIFEDDAGFNPDFESQNKNNLFQFLNQINQYKFNWDMLWFGYHDTGMKQLEKIDDNLLHIKQAHRTHAFLASRTALEYILYFCKLDQLKQLPIDWVIDYTRKSAITLGPHYTLIDQVDQISYINENKKIINETEDDYISSLDLLKICNQHPEISFDENNNLKLKNSISIKNENKDKIYIQFDLLESFVDQVLPFFNHPIILFSGFNKNNNHSYELLNKINQSNKIHLAYIENLPYNHLEKIKFLPKGLDFNSLNFQTKIKEYFKNKFNTIFTICYSPYKEINHPLIFNEMKKDKLEVFNEMSKYVFIICYSYEEITEVILLGHFAICFELKSYSFYDEFPVLFLKDKEELNEYILKEKYEVFKNTIYSFEKLKLNYWKNIE